MQYMLFKKRYALFTTNQSVLPEKARTMKTPLFLFLLVLVACSDQSSEQNPDFIADDVLDYRTAYDLVIATTDSAEQADILEREFFAKGTPGLTAIMEQRSCSKEDYRRNINEMPGF